MPRPVRCGSNLRASSRRALRPHVASPKQTRRDTPTSRKNTTPGPKTHKHRQSRRERRRRQPLADYKAERSGLDAGCRPSMSHR